MVSSTSRVVGVALACALLCSCATVRLAGQGNVRSPIEQASYSILLPNDADWKAWAVSNKEARETVLFETLRTWPITGEVLGKISILVLRNEAGHERWEATEEQIGDEVRNREEQAMRVQGAGTYELHDVVKDVVTVGGKKLYRMSYKTSRSGNYNEAILCVYIPDTFKHTHSFYMFLLNGNFKSGRGMHIDFDYMVPVIEGFRLK